MRCDPPSEHRAALVPLLPGMVRLSGGSFELVPPASSSERAPSRSTTVEAFDLDGAEVTVADYRACTTCTPPGTGDGCTWGVTDRDDYPVNCVTWQQAQA